MATGEVRVPWITGASIWKPQHGDRDRYYMTAEYRVIFILLLAMSITTLGIRYGLDLQCFGAAL